MKKPKATSKFEWIYLHRLSIFAILLFVVFPIIIVSSVYVMTYQKAQPTLFEDTSAKVISYNDMDDLVIEYRISEYRDTSSSLTNGYYKIEYTLTKVNSVNTIATVSIQFELATRWGSYQSTSTAASVTLGTEKTSIIAFNYDMNQTVLPFIHPTGPFLYAKITYAEMILGEQYNRTVYIKLPIDFIKDNTTIIPA